MIERHWSREVNTDECGGDKLIERSSYRKVDIDKCDTEKLLQRSTAGGRREEDHEEAADCQQKNKIPPRQIRTLHIYVGKRAEAVLRNWMGLSCFFFFFSFFFLLQSFTAAL